MANKLISQMGLPNSISNIFAARNILTAKDALSLPEFDLMALLGIGLDDVRSAVARISEAASPPCRSVLGLMEDRLRNENAGGHLPTRLKGLDEALCGGLPFGCLTEIVGPVGIGKTQFCLKLALSTALPVAAGGMSSRVLYIDTECKFSSRRMIEIAENSFPEIFHTEGMVKEVASRIIVMQPTTISEFTQRLQQVRLSLFQHEVRLLIVDSMAAIISGEHENSMREPKRHLLGFPVSFLKSLAEFSRVPIVVTNQVRHQKADDSIHYDFEDWRQNPTGDSERINSHLVAALGIKWAHAVTVRLIFDSCSGKRFIKVAKSPLSPPLAFPFRIDTSGISLLSDDGVSVMGPAIGAIRLEAASLLQVTTFLMLEEPCARKRKATNRSLLWT